MQEFIFTNESITPLINALKNGTVFLTTILLFDIYLYSHTIRDFYNWIKTLWQNYN
mgnify:CR=1 FL=1